jgi:hypothetical protein
VLLSYYFYAQYCISQTVVVITVGRTILSRKENSFFSEEKQKKNRTQQRLFTKV